MAPRTKNNTKKTIRVAPRTLKPKTNSTSNNTKHASSQPKQPIRKTSVKSSAAASSSSSASRAAVVRPKALRRNYGPLNETLRSQILSSLQSAQRQSSSRAVDFVALYADETLDAIRVPAQPQAPKFRGALKHLGRASDAVLQAAVVAQEKELSVLDRELSDVKADLHYLESEVQEMESRLDRLEELQPVASLNQAFKQKEEEGVKVTVGGRLDASVDMPLYKPEEDTVLQTHRLALTRKLSKIASNVASIRPVLEALAHARTELVDLVGPQYKM
jgi:hypothetical protein